MLFNLTEDFKHYLIIKNLVILMKRYISSIEKILKFSFKSKFFNCQKNKKKN